MIDNNVADVKQTVDAYVKQACASGPVGEKCCDLDSCLNIAIQQIKDTSYGKDNWQCPKMFQDKG